MQNEKFCQGYVQVDHDMDVGNSGNDINPYDAPFDDLPVGCTANVKPVSLFSVIWEKTPLILLVVGLVFLVWGCLHG